MKKTGKIFEDVEMLATKRNIFISVESRKGGVGKTTAALNLAKLLKEKDYAVLFLDLDITGTNIVSAHINKSPFWEGITHIVKRESTKDTVNLLAIFEQQFMVGSGVPNFTTISQRQKDCLSINSNKINVMGSQIYGEKGIICKPNLLFDELHAFWFIEFLQKLCNNFSRIVKRNNVAVVIDNSPGYVGVAPVIQEWLTDVGPSKCKFLTISSLDIQDIISCSNAVEEIHHRYLNKWNTSCKFRKAFEKGKEGKFDLNDKEKRFFFRLFEEQGVKSNDMVLSFYLPNKSKENEISAKELGAHYAENIEKYQGIVVNRVPREIKKGVFFYDFHDILENVKNPEFIENLLETRSVYPKRISQSIMVGYDEYIEYQFLQSAVSLGRDKYEQRKYHFEKPLLMYVEECSNKIPIISTEEILLRPRGMIHAKHLVKLQESILRTQDIFNQILHYLSISGLSHVTRLIHEEWQPGYILQGFNKALRQILVESEFPYFEIGPMPFMPGKFHPELFHFMEKFPSKVRRISKRLEVPYSERYTDDFIPSLTWALALSTVFPHYIFREKFQEEFLELFAVIAAIQSLHWEKRGRKKNKKINLSMFLANEKLGKNDIEKFDMKFHFLRHFHGPREFDFFPELYTSCCKAQARLIDLQKDIDFLLMLIRQLVRDNSFKRPILPYIRGIAEKVIVKKTLLHERGKKEFVKGFASASYMEEFENVLSGIVEKWGIL